MTIVNISVLEEIPSKLGINKGYIANTGENLQESPVLIKFEPV